MQKSKTICFISALFYPHLGGVERYTYQIAKKLVESGNQVYILTTNTNDAETYELKDGIHIYRLPVYKKMGDRYPVPKRNQEYNSIIEKFRDFPFDSIIINTRFYLTTLLGLRIAKEKNIRPVVIEHGTGHFTVNNSILDFFGRIYENLITAKVKSYKPRFFGVSHACNKWLKNFNIESSGVLYNGIDSSYTIKNFHDLKNEYNLPANNIIVSFAGRLIKEKGILEFIEAAKIISQHNTNFTFLIAGTGPLTNDIKEQTIDYKNIIILGGLEYDRVMNFLQQTDMLVCPSKYPEGLPTIILEAGLNRCTVIATPQGGTPEVIDEETGILVRTGSISDIVDAVLKLASDTDNADVLATNLNNKVKNEFDWNILAVRFLEKIYSE